MSCYGFLALPAPAMAHQLAIAPERVTQALLPQPDKVL
jgi:hypothetical protein